MFAENGSWLFEGRFVGPTEATSLSVKGHPLNCPKLHSVFANRIGLAFLPVQRDSRIGKGPLTYARAINAHGRMLWPKSISLASDAWSPTALVDVGLRVSMDF